MHAKIDLKHRLFLAMNHSQQTNQSNRGKTSSKTPVCAYCKVEGHWIKNFEEITCPKLKEKKQQQKLERQATKTKNVRKTPLVNKEIETTNNFDVFKKMMDQEEHQQEVEQQKQQQMQQEQEDAKKFKRDTKKASKKAIKKKTKASKNTEQVYYDMPEDIK